MMTNEVVVIYLSCFSLAKAMIFFNNVQVIPINDVQTLGGDCYLFGRRFSGTLRMKDRCETWTCFAAIRTVVVVRCAKLPENCYSIGYHWDPLPKCCNTMCDPNKYVTDTGTRNVLLST
uniref:8.9 kDa family member n=1 Tax=Rhipicephalus appendiculatus TaxID=34631 RepID=A0A131YFL2_RHIAP